jgi:hypothetical protein
MRLEEERKELDKTLMRLEEERKELDKAAIGRDMRIAKMNAEMI